MSINVIKYIIVLTFLSIAVPKTIAQTTQQIILEKQRKKLQEELKNLSQLRINNKNKEASILDLSEDLRQQIQTRSQLISVTNKQVNTLSRNIDKNLNQISNLRDELEVLKKDYAQMIEKSYKSKNSQSRVMFLLSSENFKQAYKRVQYMKQYAAYRKKQGKQVKERTLELQQLNAELLKQRSSKKELVAINKNAQEALNAEKKLQEKLIATIRAKESKFAAQIKKKQAVVKRIDKEIDKLIKAEIAARNAKRATNKKPVSKPAKKGALALTPEEALIAKSFAGNRGKHLWPVERGKVIRKFGKSQHPTLKNITTYSSGVDILTTENAVARSIFEGEVLSIAKISGANTAVYILHGDYITIYQNLKQLKVKKGDKVKRKQALGTIATNAFNGKTIIKFSIRKNVEKLNPASWVLNM